MADIRVMTMAGSDTVLTGETVNTFKSSLRGTVVFAGDPGYNDARSVWNAMIDKKPALIVRCADAADVVKCVKFCREHDLLTSVRGGGHNIAGSAICNSGLMIDLSLMKSVRVNIASRTAQAEPGATLGDVDNATQAYSLAVPVGINSTTGIAGLTLGGGFGWLSRKYGLTIDNLLSADVVTAEANMVTASEKENSDLFWAIRGGGGNFGIVTSFEFRLHSVGPEVLAGLVVHPLDAAHDVLRFYRDFFAKAPEELVCWFVMRKAPPLPFLAPEWHGKEIVVLAVCYSGKIDDGERAAKPLRTFGKPLADIIAPMPFKAWQTILDPLLTPGMRNYWKSHDFRELSDGLIDVLTKYARQIPDPQCEIAFAQLGGAVSRIPQGATAYTHRDAQYVLNVHGRWDNAANDAKCIAWTRELFQAAAPFSTGGAYVNFMTQEEQDRVRSAYGSNYERLLKLKNKYDPKNFFRMNQNIMPSGT